MPNTTLFPFFNSLRFFRILFLFWGVFLLPNLGLGQDFTFYNQTQLNNFDQDLTSITGSITINSPNIVDLSPLGNLTHIGGNLNLIDLYYIPSLEGLNNLEEIGGDLNIETLFQLTEINALSNLESIGGSLTIFNNDDLETLAPLANIEVISGDLIISSNNNLYNLVGLENLTIINGSLLINGNNLNSLASLANLNLIGENIRIIDDANLQDLTELSNLDSIGGNVLIDNTGIKKLNGLQNFEKINGHFALRDNDSLIDISALSGLDTVLGSLEIRNNSSLSNIDFAHLSYVERLSISKNELLQNINGFSSLERVDESLIIQENSILEEIAGFENLTSIGGFLSICDNVNLISINGFFNIENIEDFLWIKENIAMIEVQGFPNLENVNGAFMFKDNSTISDINGFSNLTSVGGLFRVSNNPNLSDCCILLPLLSISGSIGGEIFIENNNIHCNSQEEIFEHCEINYFTNPPCINASNGSISIQIFTNAPPYQYNWQNTTTGQSDTGTATENNFTISNLVEGTYNITITDSENNEFIEENIILTSIPGSIFEIIEITTTNSSNTISNGAIHLNIAGGFPPYTYQWSGTETGSQSGVDSLNLSIPNLLAGEYTITVTDNNGSQQTVSLTLLDETVPVFPCTQPLDIVILNDVSGSVDAIEYAESKQFFIDFLEEVNIGTGEDESRAAIIEWSNSSSQSIQIPITDNIITLQNYIDNSRAFEGNTAPHEAMTFGKNYLDTNARPEVEKVLILSTDGTSGQVSPSLIGLADQFKAEGYHIITIAFDNAFSNITTREILRQVASIDLLAPGSPAYSQLDEDLAENIVNIYLCPIDPGSSATVYFERDGAIDILDIKAIA